MSDLPFIPFPTPISAPITPANEEPRWSLCWNDDWNPAIMGALKVLCRPESWKGTEADVIAAIQDAQTLIGSIAENCPELYCSPVFIGTAGGYQGHSNTSGHAVVPAECLGCSNNSPQFVGHRLLNLGGTADQAYQFEDNDTGLTSGIHVCEFRAWQTDSTVGNVFLFDWLDCLGVDNQEQQLGGTFLKSNFIMQKWGLSSLAPYAFYITWDGPILCTQV